MDFTLILIFCALGGYLLGSIPFGLVLTRLAGYGDIRKIGSGNIGATNVLRTGNKGLALLTVLLDAFKAGFAAWMALKLIPAEPCFLFGIPATTNILGALTAGLCGIIGHMFPIWLKFKGGKGVSSAFGFLLAMSWPVALIALFVWLAMACIFKYSSLSALTAAASIPFIAFFTLPAIYTIFYTVIAALVILKHHANISRLVRGQESKISFKKKKETAQA